MTRNPARLLPPLTPLAPDEQPVLVLLRALRHIARIPASMFSSADEKRQALYLAAVAALAETCEGPQAVTERMSRTLPHSSTEVKAASADELRRYCLALYGLACDRQRLRDPEPTYPRSLSVWLRAADEALRVYPRRFTNRAA